MGKELPDTRPKIPQSQIPVITPRPSQSSLPSSLSTPHLGLVPPTRYPAVSGTPGHPTTGSNTSATGVAGGLASLRSFRNLLSFGPARHNAVHTSTITARPFGGLRRSSQTEPNTAAPPTHEKSQEDLPVMSIEMSHTIELSHRVNEPLIDTDELQTRLGLRARTPETISPVSSSANSVNTIDAPTTPSPMGVSELSTILEADTSGLSQGLRLDDSREEAELSFTNGGPILKTVASGPLLRPRSAEPYKGQSCDASPLNLSTSMVSSEVLAAMSGSQRSRGWLDAVVVDDMSIPRVTKNEVPTPDISFDPSTTDPAFVAFLSPGHLDDSHNSHTFLKGRQNRSSPSSPVTPAQHIESPACPSTPTSPARSSPAQSTPARRSSSIARPSISKLGTSSVPRLARSVSDRPNSRTGHALLPSPTLPSTPAQKPSTSSYGRASLQLRRVSPSSDTSGTRRPSSGGRDNESRKTAVSRLIAPSRHVTNNNAGRAATRNLAPSPSSPNWDVGDSVSARAGSTVGSPSSTGRRGAIPRPSLDDGGSVSAPSRLSGRERSSSLDETTQYHPARVRPTDWLGPRTAKAFAAAGLLDLEKDGTGPSASRPGSRFGTTRSERDMRSQYAPSKMAFSEAGSRTSWSRRSGSISRTAASSDILSVHERPLSSESASTPRTAFSNASTAPTSISAASSAQKHLQTELQLLQDRHALESGALLNALADSQRTTRLLRDENTQLRDQLQHLEDRLADALDELHRMQLAPPLKLPRTNAYRLPGTNMEPTRRPLPRSRLQTVVHLEPEPDLEDDLDPNPNSLYDPTLTYDPMPMLSESLQPMTDSYPDTHTRRHSTSSSVFAVLPSNMSMLLHDEGGPEHGINRPTRSVSPSPILPRIPLPGKLDQESYAVQRTTSIGNISPTTASFSMMTGSPGSLYLRPEHERLLGDMPTLDLRAEDYEHDAYDDHVS